MQRMIKHITLLLLLTLLSLGCSQGDKGKGKGGKGKNKDEAAEVEPLPVEVSTVVLGDVEDQLEATATLSSMHQVVVLATTTGRVTQLFCDAGDPVEQGQRILELGNDDLALERDNAASQVKRARAELNRLQPLLDKGYIARSEIDRLQVEVDLAREAYERANTLFRDLHVDAPLSGVVAARHVQLGQEVSTGTALFDIVDPDKLKVILKLPERSLGQLRLGQKASLTSDSFPGASFAAKVSTISPTVDPLSGTLGVELQVLEHSHEASGSSQRLRPGMFVHASIATATREQVLLVPKRALIYDDLSPQLVVYKEGAASLRMVEVGIPKGEQVEIISGVELGEEVVVVGQTGLREGAPLRVVRRDGLALEQEEEPKGEAPSGEDGATEGKEDTKP